MWALEDWSLRLLTPLTKLLLLGVTTVFIAMLVNSKKRHPALRLIPGPPTVPLLGNLMEFAKNNFEIVSTFQKIAARHNGIYRFETGTDSFIFLSKPEYLSTFYTSKANIDRSVHYDSIATALGNSLFIAGGARWKRLRELSMNCFFATAPEKMLPALWDGEQWMVDILRNKADGTPFSSDYVLTNAMIRSLHMNLMGDPVSDTLLEIMNTKVRSLMKIAYQRNFYLPYFYDAVFALLPEGRRFYREIRDIDQFLMETIASYRVRLHDMKSKGEPVPELYIYKILESGESDKTIADEFKFLTVAGVDTTVGTICFLLECLGQFPDIQQKVLEEDENVQRGLAGAKPTFEHLQQYQYLDRVVRETLRVFPVGPLISRSLTEDTYFGKYLVPKGTNIGACQIAANHDPEFFPDPSRFDPDRFLPENLRKIPAYVFNPFSAGPRGCPGTRYANMSMRIFISAIVRNFRILPGYSSFEEACSNTEAEVTFKDKNDHPIRLLPR